MGNCNTFREEKYSYKNLPTYQKGCFICHFDSNTSNVRPQESGNRFGSDLPGAKLEGIILAVNSDSCNASTNRVITKFQKSYRMKDSE